MEENEKSGQGASPKEVGLGGAAVLACDNESGVLNSLGKKGRDNGYGYCDEVWGMKHLRMSSIVKAM
jgi:hypothetical protein